MGNSSDDIMITYRTRMIRHAFATAVLLCALSACKDSQAPPPPDLKPASVEMSPSTAVIYAWQETKFSAVVKNAAGTVLPGARVRWESSDSSLIVIDSSGSGYVNLFYPMTEASATVSAISVENANARSQRAFTIKIQYSDLGIMPDTNSLLVDMGRTLIANLHYVQPSSSPEGRRTRGGATRSTSRAGPRLQIGAWSRGAGRGARRRRRRCRARPADRISAARATAA